MILMTSYILDISLCFTPKTVLRLTLRSKLALVSHLADPVHGQGYQVIDVFFLTYSLHR